MAAAGGETIAFMINRAQIKIQSNSNWEITIWNH